MRSALLALLCAVSLASARQYQDRWFYISNNLSNDAQVESFRQLCPIAKAHGYNGVCWAGVEGVWTWDAARLKRLAEVKAICAQNGLEIIPLLFSVGYGGGALGYDKNLAVGLPATDLPFKVAGADAVFQPEAAPLKNAGFEESKDNSPTGWGFTDKPGQITFIDRQTRHSGEASLRFENPGAKGLGPHARAMQEFAVKPCRQYRVQAWVKSQDAQPRGSFRFQLYTSDKSSRNLTAHSVDAGTFDWKPVVFSFNSADQEKVRLYFGSWGGQTGTFWVDDLTVEEVGLQNVLRREGCPVKVTSADGATIYAEGRDYGRIEDPKLLDFKDRPSPTIAIPAGSRIHDGETLKVSFYRATPVGDGQLSVCMSVPKLYEFYDVVARKLAEVLPSRKFLLSMDEIREGGTDLADQSRGLTMAQILGDCITKQEAILRKHHPGATVYIWSDMLDPDHNAHGNYFLVQGDFTGSLDYVPKDLVIACWYGSKAETSLRFFDQRGFRTLAAAYYDTDDLEGSKQWLAALEKTPKATGIMYTTWQNKYALLAPFGDLVAAWMQRPGG